MLRIWEPSRSLNMEQALAVLPAAKGERLWPSVAVSMLGGIRTEEARARRWSEVDLGCVQTLAPPGFANRRHCAGPLSGSRGTADGGQT